MWGDLTVPTLPAGASTDVPLPAVPPGTQQGEAVWTLRAVLATDTPWAKTGHEVAWTQLTAAPPPPSDLAPTGRGSGPRFPAAAVAGSPWARPSSTPPPVGFALWVTVDVRPRGDWPCPLPRLGLRLGLPAAFGRVRWYGGGPGEAYPDTRAAFRPGRYAMTVVAMQSPYVRPQENGARADVRWAELRADDAALRIEAGPLPFWLTARRWTSEQLDAAEHTTDLVPGDTVWINLDHAQHGIGTQSCGPAPLPQYHLTAAPAGFGFAFREVEPRVATNEVDRKKARETGYSTSRSFCCEAAEWRRLVNLS